MINSDDQIEEKKEQESIAFFLNCQNLNSLNNFGPPDSYVMVFYKENRGIAQWTNKGQTEVRNNKQNPEFTTQIKIKHIFEKQQLLRFEVYHKGQQQSQLIGRAELTVPSIIRRMFQGVEVALISDTGKNSGTLKIRGERLKKCDGNITLKLSASKVPDRHFWFWQGPCPILRFYRKTGDNTKLILIHQTEYIKNTQNPTWEETISAQKLMNGDPSTPICVQLWDYDIKGDNHHIFGENSFTIEELQNATPEKKITKEFKNNNNSFGILTFERIEQKQPSKFLDYLASGLELNLLIAIDFTSSNGNINDPNSLHSETNNQYLEAIRQVGEVLVPYDKDKKVSVFGFGCRPQMENIHLAPNQVSHCFHLNDNLVDPEVVEIDGIVKCYKKALKKLVFSSPSKLHCVINKAMQIAQQCKNDGNKCYEILMILTDGIPNDIADIIEDIVVSSHLPLSIIIIGIGGANFEDMQLLDNNDLILESKKGEPAKRDLVRFVEFKKFKGQQALLKEEVLKELPTQVEQYMAFMNIHPDNLKK